MLSGIKGNTITTGTYNIVIGNNAGDAMTTTSETVIIGAGAGIAINSADSDRTDFAIGNEASEGNDFRCSEYCNWWSGRL